MKQKDNPELFSLYVRAFSFAKEKGWLKRHPKHKNVYLATYPKSYVSWKKFKKNPLAILLRSTIYVLNENGDPVEVLPSFTKFPNLHEEPKILDGVPALGYEKIDGSFVAISRSEELGEILIRSKSAWDNFVTKKTLELLEFDKVMNLRLETLLEKRFETLMFELDCGVPHSKYHGDDIEKICNETEPKEAKLWLLGGVRKSGNVNTPAEVGWWPYMPKAVLLSDWESYLEWVKKNPEQEGLVVWYVGGDVEYGGIKPHELVKVKSKIYFLTVSLRNSLKAALLNFERFEDDIKAVDDETIKELIGLREELIRISKLVARVRPKNISVIPPDEISNEKKVYKILVQTLAKGAKIDMDDIEKIKKRLARLEKRIVCEGESGV